MAKSVPAPAQRIATRSGLLQEERLRIAGAFAGLLLAALALSGGLLWREHARARDQHPPRPAAAEIRR